MKQLFLDLLYTDSNFVYTILRITAGVVIFPYGMQKLFGWFSHLPGPIGIKNTLAEMRQRRVPDLISWLIILGQSLGSVALITGCLGRAAAAGNLIIFSGALITHIPYGWTMNWKNTKKEEGIEYFILLLSMLIIIVWKGSGAYSVDAWLTNEMLNS